MANREDFRLKFAELDGLRDENKKNQSRIQITENEKMKNSKTIIMNLEDHTIGNLIRMYLLKSKEVKFAGYRMPHPLETKVEIKVQTVKDNTCEILINTLDGLIKDIDIIQYDFEKQAKQQWDKAY
ncbi:DNA-directed polymerase II polypeptide J, putative [Ichthyophthirius multifiliis]|uniref:DNA-directed polymerase II polypeptide J, putative n=1 Tax=Ichthyophthirius multifiliis TaxID=5932 RepID=G0QUQ1_ICHMU|nr:DNA-directed polymerase II polypeptide J, putative [Ichthyophthirius multifiliis]EGR31054.1 DNA-directed polymerase II polypeptide J, putative [Ichthyophthirius multifiliis]|eukprot:XP_004034540.1 DNA-directed polymerase II polypeptide J, putative [Ichthyophthirius multifiliis]